VKKKSHVFVQAWKTNSYIVFYHSLEGDPIREGCDKDGML